MGNLKSSVNTKTFQEILSKDTKMLRVKIKTV